MPQNTTLSEQQDSLLLENQVCFAITLTSRTVIAAYKPLLEPLKLTHPQYLVMLTLWEGEPMSIRALSDRLRLDPGTLSPLVKRLELAGYVTRPRNTSDERALAIALTDEGRALKERARHVNDEVKAQFDITTEELSVLHKTLMRLQEKTAKAARTPAVA
ncbi:MAG: MarR family winged helix-turn-helix transcriptional regulator [Agrococcus casei]|uniref:Organic hydroperoxide resistance transcriptional regulator n=1 Tax=Agrococcus casei LMG 22410 TaxID=1255656 RepID=A0A1R4GBD9_9MICO|nr:MarR family transcriptional regulator [Agrococcus casei]SJM65312.1 Organic hydroperoxide resistance transcriptional regulator [Agrococcus casei LMG 22410]